MFLCFFTFNMNVPECTPQSVRNMASKNRLFVHLLISTFISARQMKHGQQLK